MEYTDTVLVLRVGKFRETDLWVRFLSPNRGVLSAFAFGGSRSRRRFTGCLDLFNEVMFRIKVTRGGLYHALQEGVLVRGPDRLRRDWRRLGPAMNCLKFLEAFGVAPDGAPAAHALFSGVLGLLEEDADPPADLPLLFRARLAFDQGYAMSVKACARCGAEPAGNGQALFLVREGLFYCRNCAERNREEAGIGVQQETLDALAYVQEYPPILWRSGALAILSPAGRRECARVVDAFVEHHVGLQWDNSRFVKV